MIPYLINSLLKTFYNFLKYTFYIGLIHLFQIIIDSLLNAFILRLLDTVDRFIFNITFDNTKQNFLVFTNIVSKVNKIGL